MKFQYLAKDRLGNSVEGSSDGESALAIRQKLRSQGLIAMSVSPVDNGNPVSIPFEKATKRTSAGYGGMRFSRIRASDLVVALSQLSIMCQSGDDLAEALNTVANQCQNPKLQQVLKAAYEDVSQGVKFSASLARHPSVFSESMIAALAAGEQAGRIVEVLDRMTRMMRKDQSLRSTVIALLMYPAVLCSITLVVIAAMLFFVLPQFATIFRDMGRAVPPLTNALLVVGSTLQDNWMIICTLAVVCIGVAWAFRNHPKVRTGIDYALLHVAPIKAFARALVTGRVFRLMGTMLENGVPLLESVRLCRNATGNRLFQAMFDTVEQELLQGEGMSATLVNAGFLPAGAAHMISTGERSGKLPMVLQSVGEYFEDEGERNLRTFVKMLEPAIIIGLGVVVATVVLSIILPLLDVTTVSR